MNGKLFLGVDGGQSSTLALICDETGRFVGAGRGGPSNHVNEPGGRQRLESALHMSISSALGSAGLLESPTAQVELEAACFGMTGGWELVSQYLPNFLRLRSLLTEPDYVVAQAAAFGGEPGVIVISGTGSIAFGVNQAGTRERAGGWGYLMGDEGSGYDLGRQALVAAARAEDGRGSHTCLLAELLAHFQKDSLGDLRSALYAGEISRSQLAGIAPLVFRASQEGDPVAYQIIERAAEGLAEIGAAVLLKLGMDHHARVSPVGGVFQAGDAILNPFESCLRRRIQEAILVSPRYPPVLGALLLALRTAGIQPDAQVFMNLEKTSQVIADQFMNRS